MSAFCQKQTSAHVRVTSALIERLGMSALCQKRTSRRNTPMCERGSRDALVALNLAAVHHASCLRIERVAAV